MERNDELVKPVIENRILLIRGQRVILDVDLAALYGVDVKRLNEQVKRNSDRFPSDFCFRLTSQELAILKSQFATSSSGHGGRRKLPFVFTEHGAIMAASVLNSPQAVEMSVLVVRAFVRLRELVGTHKELALKLAELESKLEAHDETILSIIDAIRQLMEPPGKPEKQIGFRATSPRKQTAQGAG
jgi:hypothetical protein